jgi:hypothetical protein
MSSERIVKDIRGATCKQYLAEEKIGIVMDGLRGEHSRGRAAPQIDPALAFATQGGRRRCLPRVNPYRHGWRQQVSPVSWRILAAGNG